MEGSGRLAALVLGAPTANEHYDHLMQTDDNDDDRGPTPEKDRRKAIGLVVVALVVAVIGLAFAIGVMHFTGRAVSGT